MHYSTSMEVASVTYRRCLRCKLAVLEPWQAASVSHSPPSGGASVGVWGSPQR
ncbi:MAG: hypothetical protein O8C67_16505 [Candidatus Methanoperedens sp.]|nr:hypothetical protein [Candidatus Methanoperedens sp.]